VRSQKSHRHALCVNHQSAPPQPFRPRIVFSRDDIAGAAKGPAVSTRIMIVEDDHLIALEMEGALRDAGFNVVGISTSAEEALAMASEQRPQLAVMDIRLNGDRDGIEAAIELFSSYEIRCVFATAHHTAETRRRAEPAKPLAWVPKPYTMPSLIEVVQGAVRDLKRQ
jgi:two-component system, response regulator PdtaR